MTERGHRLCRSKVVVVCGYLNVDLNDQNVSKLQSNTVKKGLSFLPAVKW